MAKNAKSLDEQIQEFKDEFKLGHWETNWQTKEKNFVYSWHWDENWDGVLVDRCRKIEAAGFTVTRFYRKMKICFKAPKTMSRVEILQKICEVVGSDWNGISFKRGCAIWWGATNKQPHWLY